MIGSTGMMVSRKVAMVCPPAVTVTTAWPIARLLLTNDAPGKLVTAVSVVPEGSVSDRLARPALHCKSPPGQDLPRQ